MKKYYEDDEELYILSDLLTKGNFNKNPFDKTNWYTVSAQSIIQKSFTKVRNRTMHSSELPDPECDIAPFISVQKQHIHKEKQQQQAATPTAASGKQIGPVFGKHLDKRSEGM